MSRPNDDDYTEVEIDGHVRRETPKAILVSIDGRSVWIPKSVLHEDSEACAEGTLGPVTVKTWFAEKEGLA